MNTKKLQPTGFFYTPESQDDLVNWIERLSGSERALAFTVMGMTWNLCSKLVSNDDAKEEQSIA